MGGPRGAGEPPGRPRGNSGGFRSPRTAMIGGVEIPFGAATLAKTYRPR
jgi:hypothetical protein